MLGAALATSRRSVGSLDGPWPEGWATTGSVAKRGLCAPALGADITMDAAEAASVGFVGSTASPEIAGVGGAAAASGRVRTGAPTEVTGSVADDSGLCLAKIAANGTGGSVLRIPK